MMIDALVVPFRSLSPRKGGAGQGNRKASRKRRRSPSPRTTAQRDEPRRRCPRQTAKPSQRRRRPQKSRRARMPSPRYPGRWATARKPGQGVVATRIETWSISGVHSAQKVASYCRPVIATEVPFLTNPPSTLAKLPGFLRLRIRLPSLQKSGCFPRHRRDFPARDFPGTQP